MGHNHCGTVNAALQLLGQQTDVATETGCPNLSVIVDEFRDQVAERNVLNVVEFIKLRSQSICNAVDSGKLVVVGAMYDVDDGRVEFL